MRLNFSNYPDWRTQVRKLFIPVHLKPFPDISFHSLETQMLQSSGQKQTLQKYANAGVNGETRGLVLHPQPVLSNYSGVRVKATAQNLHLNFYHVKNKYNLTSFRSYLLAAYKIFVLYKKPKQVLPI